MDPWRPLLTVLIALLFLPGCSQAGDLDKALDAAKKDGRVVMLELGSVGCIPCEQMKPVMAKLSDAYRGKLEVIFIDVKKDRETGRRFGVYMIPVQVFLDRNGREFHRHIGFFPYDDIVAMLKQKGL